MQKPETDSESENLRAKERDDRNEDDECDSGKFRNRDISINLSQSEVKTSCLGLTTLPHLHQSTQSAIQLSEEQLLKCETTSNSVQKNDSLSLSSSSSAPSIISISGGPVIESLKSSSDPLQNYDSRRSSTMTKKNSLLDALDLEYALLKVAARNSLGAYSLSQSLQKLTFTQSLAFPALARGLSSKRNSTQSNSRSPLNPIKPGVTAYAKVITVLILVLISILVFGAMYKYIET